MLTKRARERQAGGPGARGARFGERVVWVSAAARGRVVGAGRLLVVAGDAGVGAGVEVAAPRGGDAGRLLRVGVDGEARRLVARLRDERHLVDVAVHERGVAGELLREVAARRELVEGAVARAVPGVEVGDLRG